jgi:hypothetical protein
MVEERFWSKVDRRGPDDCWEWTAFKTPRGYGRFGVGHSRVVYAHRFSWERAHGPITDGLHVLHRCDNPSCVNPDHLWLGTTSDNQADMAAKGRSTKGRRLVEHCRHGHQYDASNTERLTRGGRRCRACNRNQARDYQRRLRQRRQKENA